MFEEVLISLRRSLLASPGPLGSCALWRRFSLSQQPGMTHYFAPSNALARNAGAKFLEKAALACVHHGLRSIVQPQTTENIGQVIFHRSLTDHQGISHLPIGCATCN